MNQSVWMEKLKFLHLGMEQSPFGAVENVVASEIGEEPDLPVRDLFPKKLVILEPDLACHMALESLLRHDVDFALVQDSPDTILGVLDREVLELLLRSGELGSQGGGSDLVVASVMSRNVCIEPDTATLPEVVERMTLGSCPCTVVVDRTGQPAFIVSPKIVIQLVEQLDESSVPSPARAVMHG